MGELFLMNRTGHQTVIKWGATKAERDQAKKTFEDYKAKGFSMFVLDEDERQGERLNRFDPDVNGIIAVPAMQGG